MAIKKMKNKIDEKIDEKNDINHEISKLIGYEHEKFKKKVIDKKNWLQCEYCDMYHPKEYYVKDMEYCIHCWAWMNSSQYNLEMGIYEGMHSQNDINELLKKTYKIHLETKCMNMECLYNKIKNNYEKKTLHKNLIEILELNKENKKNKQEAIMFNYKNRNLDVNYDESYIEI